jgi:hypothetical protein
MPLQDKRRKTGERHMRRHGMVKPYIFTSIIIARIVIRKKLSSE